MELLEEAMAERARGRLCVRVSWLVDVVEAGPPPPFWWSSPELGYGLQPCVEAEAGSSVACAAVQGVLWWAAMCGGRWSVVGGRAQLGSASRSSTCSQGLAVGSLWLVAVTAWNTNNCNHCNKKLVTKKLVNGLSLSGWAN